MVNLVFSLRVLFPAEKNTKLKKLTGKQQVLMACYHKGKYLKVIVFKITFLTELV